MKHLAIAAAAALLFTGLAMSSASAKTHHNHRHGGHRHAGPHHGGTHRVWIGPGGVRVMPPRHHRRECWYEKRVKRDWEGYRRVYTVRVCR